MIQSKTRSWLERADSIGRLAENTLLTVLLLGLIGLSAYQVLLRNLFQSGLFWADGLIRMGVLWLAMFGAVAASRDRRHIAIDVLVRSLPAWLRRVAAVAVNLFTAAVSGVLAWHCVRFVEDSRIYEETAIAGWPAWILQIVLPLGFFLIAYRFALDALKQTLRAPD